MAKEPSDIGGPKHKSILDAIMTGIFGSNTDEMTVAEGAKVEAQRNRSAQEAFGLAKGAQNDPGGEFMNGPGDVGKGPLDIIKLLGGITKFFGG